MEININTSGIKVSKQSKCFKFENKLKNEVEVIAAIKIKKMTISTSASITTDAIQLAIENNIDVVFIDKYGYPYARIGSSKFGSIATIRRNQLLLSLQEEGVLITKEIIIKKIYNQLKYLKKLKMNRRYERKLIIDESIINLERCINDIKNIKGNNINNIRNQLQGYEGAASKTYFRILSKLLPEKYQFKERSRRPSKDEFNCLLDYGYEILYGTVEKNCICWIRPIYRNITR